MKAILYITALFLLTSCSVFRKTKQTEVHKTEETEVVKQDSLVVSKKDSTYTKEESSQNENTIEIELSDSATGQTDTVRIPINGGEYFSFPIRQKLKKITVNNSQTVNALEGGQIKTEDIKQGSGEQQKKKTDVQATEKQTSSRCSLPLWNIIVIGGIVLFLIWAYRKYKSFVI